jgi:glycerol kinase
MQFQSDILGIQVLRPKIQESTALGAAYLAGLGVGFWKDLESLKKLELLDKSFEPGIDKMARQKLLPVWKRAVVRAKNWIIEES